MATATIYGWDDAIGINRIPSFSIEIKVELFFLGFFLTILLSVVRVGTASFLTTGVIIILYPCVY